MRARLLFIILAAVVVGGLAALNWGEVTRTSHLNFGVVLADAPLAGILLGALALTLLVFLVSSAIQESRNLLAWNRHSKELQAQRDLADRAEASRFTDLRQHIDATLREARQRDSIGSSEFEKSLLQSHRELRTQMDSTHRTLMARLAELEARLDQRGPIVEREVPVRNVAPVDVQPVDLPPRNRMNV
ncbi:hypothetical protein [Ramlibacter sp.]|uniref:hypothetical protein n=1 Tax=Ramlibacter sp. TaxID=1917967 RepID=UPI002B8272CD|nr:hypothetical protein [Ramlibacter sp.]HWI81253.1 hypothetical protein [Ramlibacter sp.]